MAVNFRPAVQADVTRLFQWREQDEDHQWWEGVPVRYNGHRRWLNDRLNSPACRLWIATVDRMPVGQCRIDSNGEVSYSVDQMYRGRGYGTEILKLAQQFSPHPRLKAAVDESNEAGVKTLLKAGFDERPDVDFYLWRPGQ